MNFLLQQIQQIKTEKRCGSILILTLVFTTVFCVIAVSFINFLMMEQKAYKQNVQKKQAFYIAESGIEYTKWRRSMAPFDFSPLLQNYFDLDNNLIGQYNISFQTIGQDVKASSQGQLADLADYQKTLSLTWQKQKTGDFTNYALLSNQALWVGEKNYRFEISASDTIDGKIHSNSGIRLDTQPNDSITSSIATYTCDYENSGCFNPIIKAGIWGDYESDENCDFPVDWSINFDNLEDNLTILKDTAEIGADNILYLNNESIIGYHLEFRDSGEVYIYEVTNISSEWTFLGYSEPDWYNDNYWTDQGNLIEDETFLQIYHLEDKNNLIFSLAKIWIDGEINGKATVIAAKIPEPVNPNEQLDIIINGDLEYYRSSNILGIIAQRHIIIPLESPMNLTIQAAMLSQNGSVFRPYYCPYQGGLANLLIKFFWEKKFLERCESLDEITRNRLDIYGSIASFNEHYFFRQVSWDNIDAILSFIFGSNMSPQGYDEVNYVYDPNLAANPPPYFPHPSEDVMIWQEEL